MNCMFLHGVTHLCLQPGKTLLANCRASHRPSTETKTFSLFFHRDLIYGHYNGTAGLFLFVKNQKNKEKVFVSVDQAEADILLVVAL